MDPVSYFPLYCYKNIMVITISHMYKIFTWGEALNHNITVAAKIQEVVILLCFAWIRPHLEYCIQIGAPQSRENEGKSDEDDQKAGKEFQ